MQYIIHVRNTFTRTHTCARVHTHTHTHTHTRTHFFFIRFHNIFIVVTVLIPFCTHVRYKRSCLFLNPALLLVMPSTWSDSIFNFADFAPPSGSENLGTFSSFASSSPTLFIYINGWFFAGEDFVKVSSCMPRFLASLWWVICLSCHTGELRRSPGGARIWSVGTFILLWTYPSAGTGC